MSETIERVLVVGGGIGGLCTAIALRRIGVAVQVVELNPRWDVYGVGIIQPGNALRALGALGLAEECLRQGFPMPGHQFHDRNGNPLAPPVDFPAPPGSPPMSALTRPRLHKILQDAVLAGGAEVRTGTTIASLRQATDHVDVGFTDGTDGRFDLVVGADGINSQVRAMVFGPEPKPEYIGQVCWRYNVPRPPEVDRLQMFVGSYGKAGFVPLADDLMYVLLIERPPEGTPIKLPPEGLAAMFRERLAEYGGPVAEIRDTYVTEDAAIVYRPVEAILVPSPWYRGRVVLIGDAAHATSPHLGQGAAQAVEDAVVLADEIARGGEVPAILDRHLARRFDRCQVVIEGSRQLSVWEQQGVTDADFDAVAHRVSRAVAAPL
jgi:2-polyprenyl-6-methoxyphenol hydroxylase-like FAD-dependent oxidoreductase